MSTEIGICGAVLAGGKSQRMGAEKAFIKIGKTTLIERAIQTMKSVISNPMIITNEPEKFEYLNLQLHRDIIPDSGPLGGIYTALEYATKSHVLILACDMPSVTTKIVQELYARGIHHDILVLDAGFGVEPLCAVYNRRCTPFIKRQIDQGKLKVTDFYQNLNVKTLNREEIDDSIPGNWFFNINTPADKLLAEKVFKQGDVQAGIKDH
ncbi:MAG: molybdenum cofactor guanylyltransferase [Fidelibacterota bacterium]